MSTNARIGILNEDSTITSIYTHWDGYPSHTLPILANNYNTEEEVRALIALGDLSSLGPELGAKHEFGSAGNPDWCVSYGRDRGETNVGAITHNADEWPDYGQQFIYVFNPATEEWTVGP